MRIDLDVPLWFLRTAFLPDDWIAVLLKRHDTGEAVQRVGPVAMGLDQRFQSWLRFKNARHFSIFVSVNALTPGRRSRTRESVSAVRHVFLDADRDADMILKSIERRSDLPAPSCVLRSSEGRAHVLWRVHDVSIDRAEALQRHLARELGTDCAATSAAQMTRLPGFFNHKYAPPQVVSVDGRGERLAYGGGHFPLPPEGIATPVIRVARQPSQSQHLSVPERVRRYLAATPPAIAGQNGDAHTFAVCLRLVRRFGIHDDDLWSALQEWNDRCQPPWSQRELAFKLATARRQSGRRVLTGSKQEDPARAGQRA